MFLAGTEQEYNRVKVKDRSTRLFSVVAACKKNSNSLHWFIAVEPIVQLLMMFEH
jgi:hypothetical protein